MIGLKPSRLKPEGIAQFGAEDLQCGQQILLAQQGHRVRVAQPERRVEAEVWWCMMNVAFCSSGQVTGHCTACVTHEWRVKSSSLHVLRFMFYTDRSPFHVTPRLKMCANIDRKPMTTERTIVMG